MEYLVIVDRADFRQLIFFASLPEQSGRNRGKLEITRPGSLDFFKVIYSSKQ